MRPEERLERCQWDFFWIADDARIVDRPELAYVACDRDVQYLNTVVRTAAPPARLPALIEEVGAAHRGVRSRWTVLSHRRPESLEAALRAGAYEQGDHHDAVALAPGDYRPRPSELTVRQVTDLPTLRDCLAVGIAAFGGGHAPDEEEERALLRACTGRHARVRRFVTYDRQGEPLASGGLNLYPALRLGFLWAGGTVPQARGRGAYSALVAARMAHAERLGLELVGLYARSTTSSPIVQKQGFRVVGWMDQWNRAAP